MSTTTSHAIHPSSYRSTGAAPVVHRRPVASCPPGRSFVVRFSADTRFDDGRFYGRVEHIITGRVERFGSVRELQEFFDRFVSRA